MKTYTVETHDNLIEDKLQQQVWDYVQNQSFHSTRKDVPYPKPGSIIWYKPIDGKKEYLDDTIPSVNNQYMHRCVFGNNEQDLEQHTPIKELWTAINTALGNKWTIDGDPEGIADRINHTARVYVNAQPDETIKRSHGIHRDTVDLVSGVNYSLLYFANPVWYPTWMAENIFYSDDDTTGDTQQFQKGRGQCRYFNVGWPFATISPLPGRVVVYDGRALHTTKPTAPWAEAMRYAVVFRIKKKQ